MGIFREDLEAAKVKKVLFPPNFYPWIKDLLVVQVWANEEDLSVVKPWRENSY